MSSLSIGQPTSVDGLSVYPLLRTSPSAPFYDTLSDAVRAGTLHIQKYPTLAACRSCSW